MELKILELITNAGAFTVVLAILFYYSVFSFKSFRTEKEQLRTDLTSLQKEFHEFKNVMIDKLVNLTAETKVSVDNLCDSIERNLKCKS